MSVLADSDLRMPLTTDKTSSWRPTIPRNEAGLVYRSGLQRRQGCSGLREMARYNSCPGVWLG